MATHFSPYNAAKRKASGASDSSDLFSDDSNTSNDRFKKFKKPRGSISVQRNTFANQTISFKQLASIPKPIIHNVLVSDGKLCSINEAFEDHFPLSLSSYLKGTYTVPHGISDVVDRLLGGGEQQGSILHEHQIRPVICDEDMNSYLYYSYEDVERSQEDLQEELEQILSIVSSTEECLRCTNSKEAWNARVHEAVLELAWKVRGTAAHANVKSARIINHLIPKGLEAYTKRSNIVDFVLHHKELPRHLDKIKNYFSRVPVHHQTVNQTAHETIRWHAAPIAIKAQRFNGNKEAAMCDLAVWTATYRNALRRTFTSRRPVLPMILVNGHEWLLSAQTDKENHIENLCYVNMGNTSSVEGLYQLLAVLRALADWVRDHDFDYYQFFKCKADIEEK